MRLNKITLTIGILATSLYIVGCAVPIGSYKHDPNRLWQIGCEEQDVQGVDAAAYNGKPIVFKLFENKATVPVGANYVAGKNKGLANREENKDELGADTMSQLYAPATNLAVPIFEASYAKLKGEGYPIWKDYMPSVHNLKNPPQVEEFYVLTGTINELELDTFSTSEIHVAARAQISFAVYDQTGAKIATWEMEKLVKIVRDQGDVLNALGQRVAVGLSKQLNEGVVK